MVEDRAAAIDRDFAAYGEQMTVAEAAAACRMTTATIYKAIRNREFEAMLPRGRDPRRTGRGQGYRINKSGLKRWLMGDQALRESDRRKL